MPGATLPNTGVVLPVLGGDPGEWDDILNDALANYDSHDHTTGRGVRIPVAALNIDDDIAMSGNAITEIAQLALSEVPLLTGGASALFTSSTDHNLYWRNASGVNVKITDGASLNISVAGGIAGDYASVGAEVAYDDANRVYTFKQEGAPRTWAKIDCADVRLHQFGTNEALFVGLKAPDALAGSFTITLPLVLPGAKALVHLAADGTLSASNTVTEDVIFSSANVDFSAGLKVRTGEVVEMQNGAHLKLDAGHLIDGSALFNTDNTITLVGKDGDVLHDEYTMSWSPDNSWLFYDGGAGGAGSLTLHDTVDEVWSYNLPNNGNYVRVPLQGLRPGDRIKRITVAWTGSVVGNPPTPNIRVNEAFGTSYAQVTTSRGASYYKLAFGVEMQEFTVDVPGGMPRQIINSPTVADWYFGNHSSITLHSVVNLTSIYAVSVVYDRVATPTN